MIIYTVFIWQYSHKKYM